LKRFLHKNRLIWLIALALVLGNLIPGNVVAAAQPVKLVLGGTGATAWNFSNIKPGDGGTVPVIVTNTGQKAGRLTIWISDLQDIDGTPAEFENDTDGKGELSSCLLLDVVASGLTTSLVLPAPLSSFPQSPADATVIQVSTLDAGESVTLLWKWSLPADTGNIAQGDGVFFTLNYMLEELPGQGAIYPTLPVTTTTTVSIPARIIFVSPQETMEIEVGPDGSMIRDYELYFLNRIVGIKFAAGTRFNTQDGQLPRRIEVNTVTSTFEGRETGKILSPVFNIKAFSEAGEEYTSVVFDRVAVITLRYNPAELPENAGEPYVVYRAENASPDAWERLPYPDDYRPVSGYVSGVLTHFSYYAVMCDITPAVVPPVTVPSETLPVVWPLAPANIKVENISISPAKVKPGEEITITFIVTNTGAESGTYNLTIEIPGLLKTGYPVVLGAGETRKFTLNVTPEKSGIYSVLIGNVMESFTVETLPLPEPVVKVVRSVWLMPTILAVVAVAVVVYAVMFILMKRREYRRLRQSLSGTIAALFRMAEKRDMYTAVHQQRVAELATAIARVRQMSEEQVQALYLASLIHDLGKIYIPTEILNKKGALTEDEMRVVREHTRIGHEIVESVKSPVPIARILAQHHERLNGTGYPMQLSGEAILPEARILAVADVVEAMLSPRPYRPAYDLDTVLKEIRGNAGTLYDPEIVSACVRLLTKDNFRFSADYRNSAN